MTAFLVISSVARSIDWVPDYVARTPLIVRKHGGRFVGVSGMAPAGVKTIEGEKKVDGLAIISFPSVDAAEAFLADADYAPLRRARTDGTHSEAWLFENWDEAPQFTGQRSEAVAAPL